MLRRLLSACRMTCQRVEGIQVYGIWHPWTRRREREINQGKIRCTFTSAPYSVSRRLYRHLGVNGLVEHRSILHSPSGKMVPPQPSAPAPGSASSGTAYAQVTGELSFAFMLRGQGTGRYLAGQGIPCKRPRRLAPI